MAALATAYPSCAVIIPKLAGRDVIARVSAHLKYTLSIVDDPEDEDLKLKFFYLDVHVFRPQPHLQRAMASAEQPATAAAAAPTPKAGAAAGAAAATSGMSDELLLAAPLPARDERRHVAYVFHSQLSDAYLAKYGNTDRFRLFERDHVVVYAPPPPPPPSPPSPPASDSMRAGTGTGAGAGAGTGTVPPPPPPVVSLIATPNGLGLPMMASMVNLWRPGPTRQLRIAPYDTRDVLVAVGGVYAGGDHEATVIQVTYKLPVGEAGAAFLQEFISANVLALLDPSIRAAVHISPVRTDWVDCCLHVLRETAIV